MVKFGKSFPIMTSLSESCDMIIVNKLLVWEDKGNCIIHCMGSSSSGVLYTGGDDNVIKQWCCRTGDLLQTLDKHSGTVNCLCGLDGGCVSGSEDSQIIVWGEADGSIDCVRRHEAGVRCFAYQEQHQLFLSGGADGEIRLWDISNRRSLLLLATLYDVMPINSMDVVVKAGTIDQPWQVEVFSGCGSNSDCFEIRCWKGYLSPGIETDDECDDFSLRVLPGHSHCVLCVVRDPATGYLMSSSADRWVRVWDSKLVPLAECDMGMQVTCMVVYKDILYTGSSENSLIHCKFACFLLLVCYCALYFESFNLFSARFHHCAVWNSATLAPIGEFDGHDDAVCSLCIEDGRLFSASLDFKIREHLL